jgi:hypothetical protein
MSKSISEVENLIKDGVTLFNRKKIEYSLKPDNGKFRLFEKGIDTHTLFAPKAAAQFVYGHAFLYKTNTAVFGNPDEAEEVEIEQEPDWNSMAHEQYENTWDGPLYNE